MHSNTNFYKVLSLVVIAALFSMRLSHVSEEVFVIPVENAIFHVVFIAAEDCPASVKTLKFNAKRALDIILLPPEEISRQVDAPQPLIQTSYCVLTLKDICSEIFIPPEVVA
jgi:hypothetical protein